MHTKDEEAFINFVKEFKYTKENENSPSKTTLLTDDEDSHDPQSLRSKRPRKVKDDVGTIDENKTWETNLAKLADYKGRFGNCYVPYDWVEGMQLPQRSLLH